MSAEVLEAIKGGIPLTVVGLILVFGALILIALSVSVMRRLDEGWVHREKSEAKDALSKPPTIDAITTVLISTAVTAVFQRQVAIRRIRRLAPTASRGSWQQQGRTALQTSHQVRK